MPREREELFRESNPRPEHFLPHIDLAVAQAKKLDTPYQDYPSKLGSHVYKLIEKISRDLNETN